MASLEIVPQHRPEPSGPRANIRAARDAARIVTAAVAAAFLVPAGELRATSRRSARVAFARQTAMYLAHVVFGLGYSATGRAFGRDRTTAAHACRLVEDRRNDPEFDARLAALEHTLRRLGGCVRGIAA